MGLEKATKGPWVVGPRTGGYDTRIYSSIDGKHPAGPVDICKMQLYDCPNWRSDADFIASAPADIDYLLAENARLRREIGELKSAYMDEHSETWHCLSEAVSKFLKAIGEL